VDPDSVERKLAAILSADVVGYSRLMAEDESATVRTLTDYREEMTVLIRQHRGRVVDSSSRARWMRCRVRSRFSGCFRRVTLPSLRTARWSFASGCTWAT
jgi:hypothetical protein